jgi:hypothetical protein
MSTPSTSSPTSTFAPVGNTTLDALLAGMKWGGKPGAGVTLTYSFPWAGGANAVFSGPNGGEYSTAKEPFAASHYGLNTVQQQAARDALQEWSDVANIKFAEVADTSGSVGDIRVAWTSATDTTSNGKQSWGWAYYPSATYADGGDIWISTTSSAGTDTDWSAGSYNYKALIHEIGHALGLQHPFEGKVTLPAQYDNRQYTIMAYDDAPHSLYVDVTENSNGLHSLTSYNIVPETPMVYDIAAIQYLYGANMSFHAGDDVYTFDTARPFFSTIWDAGGNDTISVANFTLGCDIDLRPGQYSSLHIPSDTGDGINWETPPPVPTYDGTGNLGIAFGATIENAIGGKGNDTLQGNDANNHLQGNAGVNTLLGGAGIDTAVYTSNFSDYKIVLKSGVYTVEARQGGQYDTVSGIERLSFKDVTVALTVDGLAEDAQTAQYTALAQKFYVAYFGRPADPNGLANMVGQLKAAGAPTTADGIVLAYQTNAAVKQLVDSFGNSEESSLLYKGTNNHDFVVSIFTHLLGRTPPEGPGLDFWVSALDSGNVPRSLAAMNIVGGAESNTTDQGKIDAALVANRVLVAENFTAALNGPSLVANYAGAEAASLARGLLDAVTQSTPVISYEVNVLSTVGKLPVQLVGVQSILHDGLTA